MRYTFVVFLAFALCVSSAQATEYFISPTGNDAGAGTFGDPWASPSRGASLRTLGASLGSSTITVRDTSGFLGSGNLTIGSLGSVAYVSKDATSFTLASPLAWDVPTDTVIHDADILGGSGFQPADIVTFRGGTYSNERLRIKNSGVFDYPITYRAYADETPYFEWINTTASGGAGIIWNDGESVGTKTEYVAMDGLKVFVDQNGSAGGLNALSFSSVNSTTLSNMDLVVSGDTSNIGYAANLYKTSSVTLEDSVVRGRHDRAIGVGGSGSLVTINDTIIYNSKYGLISLADTTVTGDHLTIVDTYDYGVHLEGSGSVNNSLIVDTAFTALSRGSGDYNYIYNAGTNYGGSWTPGGNDSIGPDPELLMQGVGEAQKAYEYWMKYASTSAAATADDGGSYVGALAPVVDPLTRAERTQQWVRDHDFVLSGYVVNGASPTIIDTPAEGQQYLDAGFSAISYVEATGGIDQAYRDLMRSLAPDAPLQSWLTTQSGLGNLWTVGNEGADVMAQWLNGEPSDEAGLISYGAQVGWLKENYPQFVSYTNALGSVSNPNGLTQKFVDFVDPDILWSDYYPIKSSIEYAEWIEYLGALRSIGLANNLPYGTWIQTQESGMGGDAHVPSESEYRMLVFSALTYGVSGIQGMTYFWPGLDDPMVDSSLNETQLYWDAQDANPEAFYLGQALRYAESDGVYFLRSQVGNPIWGTLWNSGTDPDAHIQSITISETGSLKNGLIGFFTDDAAEEYFMLSNLQAASFLDKDEAALEFVVVFDGSITSLLKINRDTGEQEVVTLTSNTLTVDLLGGTAELYKYNNGTDFYFVPNLAGDVDGDGFVDGTDLSTIIANWGMSGATRAQGDLDGNGTINAADYTTVLANWNPPASEPGTIPEPATLAMLLLGGLALLRRRS